MRLAHGIALLALLLPAEGWAGPYDGNTARAAGCAIRGNRVAAPPPPRLKLTAAEQELLSFSDGAEVFDHPEGSRYVAFTFDDGPNRVTTPRVLRALAKYDVPGTFFVVAQRFTGDNAAARAQAKILDDTIAANHVIGNHTFAHKNLRKENKKTLPRAIDRAEAAIARHTGYRPYLFRPPFGALNGLARKHLARKKYTTVIWNIDPRDFDLNSPKEVRRRVTSAIRKRGGGVVLLHDTKKQTSWAIAGILDDLEADNCKRLENGKKPILPVSLHYFVRDRDGTPRPIPEAVKARTAAYEEALPTRCEQRQQRTASASAGATPARQPRAQRKRR